MKCGGVKENSCYKRVSGSRRTECDAVVWTHGENGGGLIGKDNNRI